jgi:hypothetical protein
MKAALHLDAVLGPIAVNVGSARYGAGRAQPFLTLGLGLA